MLYPKNVPTIERGLRIAIGLVLMALAAFGWGGLSPILIGGLLVSAGFVIVTGFVGWCPACAMVGRKLKTNTRNTQAQ